MLHTAFMLLASITGLSGGADATYSLTEIAKSETTRTVTNQGSSVVTEESTSIESQWKFEASIPFTADDWARLGQNGTVSIKIGKQLIEKKVTAREGFNPDRHKFTFKLSRPVVAFTGFKYIKLPSDRPAPPPPAPGTRVVYGNGSLEFKDGKLKLAISSVGKNGPSLAGENFVAVEDGDFEGTLPFELVVGPERRVSELKIKGTAKHRDSEKGDPLGASMVGRSVKVNLDGKG